MIEVFDLSRATDLDKQKLPIQTVDGYAPDANGNVDTKRLPLSGGAMTDSDAMTRNVDNSFLGLYGATQWNKGSYIELFGQDYPDSDAAGGFNIFASNESGGCSLRGRKNGYLAWNGEQIATRHIPLYPSSWANGHPIAHQLCAIQSDSSVAPNNGVILSYGMSSEWIGQLYLGDNGDQGVYYRGKSDGTWSGWKRLFDSASRPDYGAGIGLDKGVQTAPCDGLIVCYAYSSGWGGGGIWVNGSNVGEQFGKECGGAMYAHVRKGDSLDLATNNATTWWATLYPY